MVRETASSLRWVLNLEKPLEWTKTTGHGSATQIPMICASFFGRDESGGPFSFSQAEVDGVLEFIKSTFTGPWYPFAKLLPGYTCVPVLSLAISDSNKDMMLRNPGWIPHLLEGLLLDPEHPRNQPDQPTGPPDPTVTALVQTQYAEALSQVAVYDKGREALLKDPAVVKTLEQLTDTGATEESRRFARATLAALGAITPESSEQQERALCRANATQPV